MDRKQFMRQLEALLSDIPEEERREALEYYESYFDEAGEDREAEVIKELGSPGKVAAIIKADLQENGYRHGEYAENGYEEEGFREKEETPEKREGYHPRPKRGAGTITLIIILLIFLSPFLIGGAGAALGILVMIVLLPFIIVFAGGAVVVALVVAGIAVLIAGIGVCAAVPAMGILSAGIGCIMAAAGLVGLVFLVWFISRAIPWALRGFTDFCHRLLNRGRKERESV